MKNFLTFLCVGISSIFHNDLECTPTSAITAKNEVIAAFNTTHALALSRADPLYIITVVRETSGKTELISDRELQVLLDLLETLCTGKKTVKANYDSSVVSTNLAINFHINSAAVNMLATNILAKTTNMDKSCKLIVFNEMFFSQIEPLTFAQMEFIKTGISNTSSKDKTAIFYPNFLYKEKKKRQKGSGIHAVHNTMLTRCNVNKTMAINVVDLTTCLNHINSKANIKNDNTEYDALWLTNETLSINSGKTLTKYKKATYFHEADNIIAAGEGTSLFSYALYDFGGGKDEHVEKNALSDSLLKNISLEICFDLANAMRSKNSWNSGYGESKIHIIQSNCVDPLCYSNLRSIPKNKLIVHSDRIISSNCNIATHENIIIKNDNASLFNQQSFEIILDKSKYKIKVFKI